MMLFLIGFSGCGKSTAGRRLAERLNYRFIDLDAEIAARAELTVTEIFASLGEAEFRRMESEELDRAIASGGRTIVATGGGAPCFGDNMERMTAAGIVVYFRMTPENLVRRLGKGRAARPKLAAMNDAELLDYIRRTLAEREQYYMRARVTIDCNGVDDDYLAEHIAMIVRE